MTWLFERMEQVYINLGNHWNLRDLDNLKDSIRTIDVQCHHDLYNLAKVDKLSGTWFYTFNNVTYTDEQYLLAWDLKKVIWNRTKSHLYVEFKSDAHRHTYVKYFKIEEN